MEPAAFFAEIKRRAPSAVAIDDPLKSAQLFIDRHGATGEGRALLAVVTALWKGAADFSEADLYSFSGDSLVLASKLIDARAEGSYPEWKWHRASCYPAWRFLLDLQKQYGIT